MFPPQRAEWGQLAHKTYDAVTERLRGPGSSVAAPVMWFVRPTTS